MPWLHGMQVYGCHVFHGAEEIEYNMKETMFLIARDVKFNR